MTTPFQYHLRMQMFHPILYIFLLFIAGSCAVLPEKGMDPEYQFSSIRTIGIFVDPSDKKMNDAQLFNLLSMNFMSLGYTVVDLNPSVASGNPENGISFKGYIKTALSLKNDSLNVCDAVVIARPKWRTISKKISESMNYIRGIYIDELNLELAMIDIRTQRFAVSRNITHEQNIISDARSKGMMLEPVRYQLQRMLTEELKDFPVCSVDQSSSPLYKIPVAVYVDEAYRSYYGNLWNIQIARRILYANDILKRFFGIELVVQNYYAWSPFMNTNTQAGLQDLINKTPDVKNTLVLGFIMNNTLQYNWHERNDIGIAEYFGNHLVICDLPSFPGLESWDALDEAITIIHETGHIFGAMHTMESGSIMYPEAGSSSYQFDSLNSAIILRSRVNFLTDSKTTRTEQALSILKDVYSASRTKKSLYIQTLFSLMQQDRMRIATKVGKTPSKDSLNVDLSKYAEDRALQNALEGYFHYQAHRWKEAEPFFLRAVELNPSLAEVYYYLTAVYENLDDKENMRKYWKLSVENLFDEHND